MKKILKKGIKFIYYCILTFWIVFMIVGGVQVPKYVPSSDIIFYISSNLLMGLSILIPLIILGLAFKKIENIKFFKGISLSAKLTRACILSIIAFSTTITISSNIDNLYSEELVNAIEIQRKVYEEKRSQKEELKNAKNINKELGRKLKKEKEVVQQKQEEINKLTQLKIESEKEFELIKVHIDKVTADLNKMELSKEILELMKKNKFEIVEAKKLLDKLNEELKNIRTENKNEVILENNKILEAIKGELLSLDTKVEELKVASEEGKNAQSDINIENKNNQVSAVNLPQKEIVKKEKPKEIEKKEKPKEELIKKEEVVKQTQEVNKKPNDLGGGSTSSNTNIKTYYVCAGNRYYHVKKNCKFFNGASSSSTTDISGKFACNCVKY